jgi:prephenate dehydrogenase
MLEYSSCEVVGCHPLFGPGEKNKGDLTMALCPGRGKKGISWIKGILERSGITPLIMEPAVHDRMMGIIQAANHLNTIILALCAAGSGFSLNDMEAAATPAFRERLQRIKAMLGQPSGIFSNILMDNPGRGKVLSEILRTTQRLAVMLGDGDRPGFERLFSDLGSYFIQTEEGVRSHES